MTNNIENDLGLQPFAGLMTEHGLTIGNPINIVLLAALESLKAID